MSFYDSASLAFLPSGGAGKDTKAYSIKPTDGSGDFTFSRGSNLTATRVDSNGLIEKGRENLLLQSNQFDTTWLQTSCSVTSGESGYDGSLDAWLLSKSGSNGRVRQYMTSTGVRTASIYAKEGTTSWLRITYGGKTTYFDLGNGVLGNVNAIDSTITSVGNGFYRCTLTANAASADYVNIYPADSDGVTSGTSGNIYIQDAQLEQGLVATEYIESGATTGKAGILEDSPRFDYSGGASCPSLLLEPSRTNVWKYSEYLDYSFASVSGVTISQNTTETLSPEGLYNATKLEGVSFWSLRDFIAGTNTGTWTISCYVKAVNASSNNTFRLSVGGNNYSSNLTATSEWQRFDLTITNGGATAAGILRDSSANDADLYIYGFQVEEGSYPTSYIPNHSGGSVTRDADSFQNSTNDKPLGAIGQGTWFVELQKLGDDTNQALYLAPTTSNTQQIRLHFDATNARFRDARNGYSTIGGGVNVKTSMTKMALSIDTTSGIAKVYANGSQLGSDYTLQANTFEFSRIVAEGKGFILKQSLFFPNASSDAELAALTT